MTVTSGIVDVHGGTASGPAQLPLALRDAAVRTDAAATEQVARRADRYWFLPALPGLTDRPARLLHVVLRGREAAYVALRDGRYAPLLGSTASRGGAAFDAALVLDVGPQPVEIDLAATVVEHVTELLTANGVLLLGLDGAAAPLVAAALGLHDPDARPASRARIRAWEAALSTHFRLAARYAVLPSLAHPSLLLSEPELIRQPGTLGLLQSDLTRPQRLLLPVLGRPGLIRRFGSTLTAWTRLGAEPPGRAAWDASGFGPFAATAVAVYTGKPARAVPRAFVVSSALNRPLALAKLSREPDAALAREQAALRCVHTLLGDSPLRRALPAWWLHCEHGFAYEYRAGRTLADRLSARIPWPPHTSAVAQGVDRALAWLVAFQQATGQPGEVAAAGDSHLPLGPVHGDYQPANLLIGPDDCLSVLDWEHFEERQIVAYDWLNFLTYVGLFFDGHQPLDDACRRLFLVHSRVAQHLRGCTLAYCAALRIRPGALAAAYPGFLAWRLRRRSDEGLSNEGSYLTALARFWERNATRVRLFDA